MIKIVGLVAVASALASAGSLSRDLPRGIPWSVSAGRIVGGQDTTIEQVPHQVSLRYRRAHSCGGSIISEYWIVTAAHCVFGEFKFYDVKAGTAHRTERGGSLHDVTAIIVHENYGITYYGVVVHDIALVRVLEPFKLDATRQPIGLFNAGEETPVGVCSVITGWGNTVSGGRPQSSILQIVKIPIISKEACNEAYSNKNGISEGQICAGYPEGGADSCQGDSGGPMTVNGRLAGIVSWGDGCAVPGKPGVYTEVAAYHQWIKHNSDL